MYRRWEVMFGQTATPCTPLILLSSASYGRRGHGFVPTTCALFEGRKAIQIFPHFQEERK
jgi:hypothetical protein